MKYTIDTSALMEAEVRHYPRAVFPSLWVNIEDLVSAGELVASEEVSIELAQYAGDLDTWCKARPAMFLTSNAAIQTEVARIMAAYPDLVPATGGSRADPFVIATATLNRLVVVSQERRVGPGGGRPKIPNVCDDEGVAVMSLLEMIRVEGWTF